MLGYKRSIVSLVVASALACSTKPALLDVGEADATEDTEMDPICDETSPCSNACIGLGDGHYCGSNAALSNYEGDPNDLLQCQDGLVVALSVCTNACLLNPVSGTDGCSPPDVCGDAIVAESEACDGGPCCDACSLRSESHVCDIAAEIEYGCPWGMVVGGDIGMRARDRHCGGESADCDGELGNWGIWHTVKDCGLYEMCPLNPIEGSECICVASSGWDPNLTYADDADGRQYNQGVLYAIDVPLQFELSESPTTPGQLRVRVCNTEEPLALNETVHIYLESLGHEILFDGLVSPNGSPCSNYGELQDERAFALGEVLDGQWRAVRPGEVADDWDPECYPVQVESAAGTCWWRVPLTPAIRRTCVNL